MYSSPCLLRQYFSALGISEISVSKNIKICNREAKRKFSPEKKNRGNPYDPLPFPRQFPFPFREYSWLFLFLIS